ncbi:hypothetical protein [Pseudonocardia humida]|uniref:Uncharacterized protein n=1 Tax=Pseudonocardia humida TaxID=2800819 RepID=A0ABT1A9D6_9PSEU|nr:hypothetical protein [Pseudonocardia humida]MCO1659284.1 hypothetical protein [Pseudonocardia humida]
MPAELTSADRALLRDLAAVLARVAAVPPDVVRAAKGLFTWRTVDAELAAVAYDSLLDDGAAAARSVAGPRIVTFEAGDLTVEVEVDDRPSGRRLVGQLVPAQPAALELRQLTVDPSGAIATTADELGRFLLPMPAEVTLVRVRVTLADGRVVESAAVRL